MREIVETVVVHYHGRPLEEHNVPGGHPDLIPGIVRGVFLHTGVNLVFEVVAVGPGQIWGYKTGHMSVVCRFPSGTRISIPVNDLMEDGAYKIVPRPADWPLPAE